MPNPDPTDPRILRIMARIARRLHDITNDRLDWEILVDIEVLQSKAKTNAR